VDLHVLAPLPSPAEREAIDAVLGPPASGWEGGERDPRVDGHVAYGGATARARRHLLLPALQAVQARTGWISRGALGYICRRLSIPPAEAYGVASFYALLATEPRPPAVLHLCDDLACRLAGAEGLCRALEAHLGPPGSPAGDGRTTWLRSPCLGRCEQAPVALLTVAGETPQETVITAASQESILDALSLSTSGRTAGSGKEPGGSDGGLGRSGKEPGGSGGEAGGSGGEAGGSGEDWTSLRASCPQLVDGPGNGLQLIGRIGRIPPTSLDAYRAEGGYRALERALEMGPAAVIEEVTTARLVGRGGAAFPTGRKWAAVAAQPVQPHYLVANADESEPGTFKDRLLMEGDPFAVLEGMTIAAFAVGASQGYLYIRGEYGTAARTMAQAIAVARRAGLLGEGILGSGFRFDVEIRRGAGAYIAGEETALFNSIEGKRAEPRNKPPFPVTHGLFGRPTLINNIETLVNVPLVLRLGGAAYAQTGTDQSTGPKLFCLSGRVARPGLYEVPFGTTLGELLELAGGVAGGRPLRAVLLGGAAGTFVGPDALSLPLTFEGTRAVGASLGSGVVLVLDETVEIWDLLRRIAAFFRDESCGQCVPCRVGTVRQEELLARLAAGRPRGSLDDELALFREIAQAMRDASICGLGQTASLAIESALRVPGLVPLPGVGGVGGER
jgi:NADH-quinone oxidoreductase subunit F